MIVYLDLLFFVNFVIDGALLLVTAWTMHTKPKMWRITASAAIGAGYVLFILVPGLSFLYTLGIKFFLSVLMIGTAFGFGSLQRFLRLLGAFYVANFAAAGGVFGVYYMLMSSDAWASALFKIRSGGADFGVPAGLAALALPVLVWLYLRIYRSGKRKADLLSYTAEVKIAIGEFCYSCCGLVDTGNQLYDPLTKTPVMVLEASEWSSVLPDKWLQRIRKAETDQIVASFGEEEFLWQDRLRLVPYRGVNRATQFMLAIKPDRVTVAYNGKEVETHKVLVGLDGGKLSADGSYHAILHPRLWEA